MTISMMYRYTWFLQRCSVAMLLFLKFLRPFPVLKISWKTDKSVNDEKNRNFSYFLQNYIPVVTVASTCVWNFPMTDDCQRQRAKVLIENFKRTEDHCFKWFLWGTIVLNLWSIETRNFSNDIFSARWRI